MADGTAEKWRRRSWGAGIVEEEGRERGDELRAEKRNGIEEERVEAGLERKRAVDRGRVAWREMEDAIVGIASGHSGSEGMERGWELAREGRKTKRIRH